MNKNELLELLKEITIGKVIKIEKHPNADKLLVVDIYLGDETLHGYSQALTKRICTAANNFKEGDVVPYLGIGTVVPGFLIFKNERVILGNRDMRGINSEGMILAEDEIGLSEDHTGIYILPADAQEYIGNNILKVLSESDVQKIMSNAKAIEITPELQRRIDLIMSIGENGGEVVGADELPAILTSGEQLFSYDGFEPSGQMHIAQGIIRAINTNKMIDAGFTFKMWVADWFGYLNNKMGGDLNKIKKVGEYFIEIWRASGMNLESTQFLWTSDFVNQPEYWELVMKIAKSSTLNRILRTTEIMGRSASDDLSAAQIIYPCMQIADIFYVMKCQVTQLGLDQRKVNMLAREIGEELGFWKPVIVSQGMLQGLNAPKKLFESHEINLSRAFAPEVTIRNYTFKLVSGDNSNADFEIKNNITNETAKFSNSSCIGLPSMVLECEISADPYPKISPAGPTYTLRILKLPVDDAKERAIAMKMSKSKPDTAIFMTDTLEDIKRKITKAYCPEGEVEDNPILAYCKQIIFQAHYLKRQKPLLENGKFKVEREERFGGNVEYSSYEELEKDYVEKKLYPLDLKTAVIGYIDELIQPVRSHFETDPKAKALLEEVRSYQITR